MMVWKNPIFLKIKFIYCNIEKKSILLYPNLLNTPNCSFLYPSPSSSTPLPLFNHTVPAHPDIPCNNIDQRETIQYSEHRPIPPEVRIRANSFCGGCWTVCETSSELDMLIPISFPYSSFTSRDGGAEIYQKSQELGFLDHDLKVTLST